MSLVERQEAAQQTAVPVAPAAPVTPAAPPSTPPPPIEAPEAKPYKHLVVIAAVLVLVAVVTSCAILLSRTQTVPKPTSAPLPPGSAGPTLTAKQQAAAQVIARYTAYVKAIDESAQAGSNAAGVKRLVKEFTVNPQSSYDIASGKSGRAGKYRSTGYSKVTARVESISSLSAKVPVAILTTCTDNTGYTIFKAGKPITRTFQFIKGTITMKRVNDRWMVANSTSANDPARESCTV